MTIEAQKPTTAGEEIMQTFASRMRRQLIRPGEDENDAPGPVRGS